MTDHPLHAARDAVHAAIARGDRAELDRIANYLDGLDAADVARRAHPMYLARAAAHYAACGVPVFPVQGGDKKPYRGSRGLDDATTDAVQVRAWWTAAPLSNIGVPTGVAFDAIDIDGPAGLASLMPMWDEVRPTALGVVSTPRPGGLHILVPVSGHGNRVGIVPGVDFRGKGGYVVVPPSRSTEHGRSYTWLQVPSMLILADRSVTS